jgi:hypothetical protein
MTLGVKLVEARDPATEEAVKEAERLLEVRIPEEYRRFLLQESNGGRPENCLFSREDRPRSGVDEFLGVGLEGDSDLVTIYSRYRDRMPSWCLPFASSGGDWFCLSLRDEDRGAVLFWFHEEEADEGQPPTERNLYPVAGEFDEFAAGLRPIDEAEVDIDPNKVEGVWVDPKFAEEMRRQGLMD